MIWGEDDDGALICRAIWAETRDVKTFLFAPVKTARFAFSAGQFMTFTFPINGAELQRCYTIASPPSRPDCVAITVKRKPGGMVSPWLHDVMRPGMMLTATGAMGDFTEATPKRSKWALLAAGSGITPVMSMLRHAADRGLDRDIVLINSAHTPADLIFQQELHLLARGVPGLRVFHLISQAGADWSGLRGRLSRPLLDVLVPDLHERALLCCGPSGYATSLQAILAEVGFDLAHFHTESFTFDEAVETPISASDSGTRDSGPRRFTIQFARSEKSIFCDGTTTVLAAAREAGLRLPFSCAKGVCGTCKTKLLSGEVDMQHGGGIRPKEIAQGLALLCCSRPLGDLVIDR